MGGARGARLDAALGRVCTLPLWEPDGGHPWELHEAVEELIAAHGSDDVGEPVAEAVAAGRADRARGADLLNIAAWSGTDNGTALGRTLTTWLRAGDDPVRVHLALHHEAYPFPTRGEMLLRLPGLADRFPEHRALVERRLAARPARPTGGGPELRAVLGELTAQDTEAVVTAVDPAPGAGTDAPGRAVITPAVGLSPRIMHVIAVPAAMAGKDDGPWGLASCHRDALAAADGIGVHSVAFPMLGSSLPVGEAARIAVRTLAATPTSVELVRLVTPDAAAYAALTAALYGPARFGRD
ncbi:macro domain-containing protein [Streptomyces cadmiisoli]|nr:macro domain-containing protein [Streptomyces cadmiisoli]